MSPAFPLVWLIPCATEHDTLPHRLTAASKTALLLLMMNGFLVVCAVDCREQLKAVDHIGPTMHPLNWTGWCGGNALDLCSGDALLESLTSRWLCWTKFSWFFPVLTQKCQDIPSIRERPLPNHQARRARIIMWFDTLLYSDLLTAT
jgi:hypothetical protein